MSSTAEEKIRPDFIKSVEEVEHRVAEGDPTLTVKKSNSSSMFTILAGKPI